MSGAVRRRFVVFCYGGIFDPVHLGHVSAALDVLVHSTCDELRIVPAGVPPHRGSARQRSLGSDASGAEPELPARVCCVPLCGHIFTMKDWMVRAGPDRPAGSRGACMAPDTLCDLIVAALDNLKGQAILTLDIAEASSIADWMVIASGDSRRHVQALASRVVDQVKVRGVRPLGIEGLDSGEWVLVDCGDVIIQVMQSEVRAFYDLERLWQMPGADFGQAIADVA